MLSLHLTHIRKTSKKRSTILLAFTLIFLCQIINAQGQAYDSINQKFKTEISYNSHISRNPDTTYNIPDSSFDKATERKTIPEIQYYEKSNDQPESITADRDDIGLQDQLEEITIRNEEYYDFIDLIDESYTNRRININNASAKVLSMIGLNREQIDNIEKYKTEYGELSSIYELHLVEGFDSAFIQKISPNIRFDLNREIHQITSKDLILKGKQTIVFRLNRNLQLSKAYQEDTAIYIGSPDKILIRYNYRYYDRLKVGITLEKDAGEKMPDYIGWHAYYGGKKIIKDFVLGSYNLSLGQGLNMSSSFSFSKSLSILQSIRSSHVLRSSSGANENYGLNGVATTLRLPLNSELTAIYSFKRLDGSISKDSVDKEEFINTVYETGLHRSFKELKYKDAFTNQVYGISFSKKIRNLSLGIITHQTLLSATNTGKDKPYKLFDFTGNKLSVGGFYATLSLKTIEMFGETSLNLQTQGNAPNDKRGFAGLAGLRIDPSGSTGITILYRYFSPRYQNFNSNAFSESTSINNEQGVFVGLRSVLSRKIVLSAYADLFKFPWLKYRIDAPSTGCEYMVNLNYKINLKDELSIKYVYKSRMQNYPFDNLSPVVLSPDFNEIGDSLTYINKPNLINYPQSNESHTFRLLFSINPTRFLQLRSRVDYNFHKRDKGFLIAQDVIYKPIAEPFQLYLRYALFDIESFDNRIYMYENDVLYSFSIPVFTGKGSRFYLMSKISFNRIIDFWIRYAYSLYPGKNTIGTGMDEIKGDSKSELKFQIILRI